MNNLCRKFLMLWVRYFFHITAYSIAKELIIVQRTSLTGVCCMSMIRPTVISNQTAFLRYIPMKNLLRWHLLGSMIDILSWTINTALIRLEYISIIAFFFELYLTKGSLWLIFNMIPKLDLFSVVLLIQIFVCCKNFMLTRWPLVCCHRLASFMLVIVYKSLILLGTKKWWLVSGHQLNLLLHQIVVKLSVSNSICIFYVWVSSYFHFLRIIVCDSNIRLPLSLLYVLTHKVCEVLLFMLILTDNLSWFSILNCL